MISTENKANTTLLFTRINVLMANTNTFAGSIWRSLKESSLEKVVVKVTNSDLHSKSIVIVNGIQHKVNENILMEKAILKYLTYDPKKQHPPCPKSIIKYVAAFKR